MGFEPTVDIAHGCFQDSCLKPDSATVPLHDYIVDEDVVGYYLVFKNLLVTMHPFLVRKFHPFQLAGFHWSVFRDRRQTILATRVLLFYLG